MPKNLSRALVLEVQPKTPAEECNSIAEALRGRIDSLATLSRPKSEGPSRIGIERRLQSPAHIRERQRYFWLSNSLDCAADGILIVNPKGIVQYLNPVAQHLTGWPQRQALGLHYSTVLHMEHAGLRVTEDLIHLATLSHEPLSMGEKLTLISRDGRQQQIEAEISTESATSGSFGGAVFTMRDIGQRKWEEEQHKQEHTIRAVERLAETTAHTLNNLLTSIVGNSELLLHSLDLSDEHRDNVTQMQTAGQNIATVVRQLSEISRVKGVTRHEVDLNKLIASYLPVLADLLSPGIVLTSKLELSLRKISADPAQLQQILFNLVANCQDAMGSTGAITISTHNFVDDASERLRSAREYVAVKVCDTGEGINPETREHVFEPFFTTKKDGKHAGLGLSIAQGIVRDYHGSLEVASEPGVGTEVTFSLPAIEVDPYAYMDEDRDRPAHSAIKTILVVEDEHPVRQLVRKILERNGYQVIEAHDGEGALAVAETHNGWIDLLVTDIQMPGITGSELVRQFAHVHPETKFLVISGFSANRIGPVFMPAGFKFLQKPFKQADLLGKIKALLADC